MTLDIAAIRKDFPILHQEQNGKRLVFLDSAASSQRPNQVIDAISDVYRNEYANVHRGVYQLAVRATNLYENARNKTADFIGAASSNEIIFTKNATESINLVARSWGQQNLQEGDVVVLSLLEHHANIVPWQMLQEERGIELRWIGLTESGQLDLSNLDDLLTGAKLLAITAMSNVLGTLTPISELAAAAHKHGALILVDGCQSVPHLPTNVVDVDIDFLVFSPHKMLGPSGLGVLWAREQLLDEMSPFLGGGGMILNVTQESYSAAKGPAKFEAGTPPIAQAAGLTAAIDYLNTHGLDTIRQHEIELTTYALETLPAVVGDDLKIPGPTDASQRGGVLSLELGEVHAHDISQMLDEHAVCVRPGHHCAKPLMRHYGVAATARASLYLYNDHDDVDALAAALLAAKKFFAF